MTVLIAGGGIAGLALGLTCHQIGLPFRIYETVSEIRPLGVGINLQPNAVRELFELGLEDGLSGIGVQTQEFGLFSKKGLEIWTEPRGKWAGYSWPQYSVHRGHLQMLLYKTLIERAGPDCIVTGQRATGFENTADGVTLHLRSATGEASSVTGSLLIGADGIHSAIRAQIAPGEGAPKWGGAVLWRGTALAKPFRTGATMVMIGHKTQRIVAYPISKPDPETGLAVINWIAELTYDPGAGWNKEDWNRVADINDFMPKFEGWTYDWLDFPALVAGADRVYEYPMVDRDPIGQWTVGKVSLMGDAAHAAYPVGSNGASQAIVDARKLGAAFLEHGASEDALQAYEAEMRPATAKIVLTNRGAGPDAVLQVVEDRCGGSFNHVNDVISQEELTAHAHKYKAIAGFAIDALNSQPSLIPEGARS
ncbi:flavin-dependent oxidoreductase [Roseibium suaedae]|uniref:2-polyprenyl-6-methoxyphenol hydroxylase n=1 Tax=Roseibium suaedae TaxID=735517 RepID=A0A1M7HQL6_9HYPH|nr:flavin-dependent oxidoreductase [Roseibium suaedae]SHM30710.1 2-polyprenyl-6-methoxyphenol hydroxylase [Roseibium suaedae]